MTKDWKASFCISITRCYEKWEFKQYHQLRILNNIINSGYSDRSFARVLYISDGATVWSSLFCATLPGWSSLFSIYFRIFSFLLSSSRRTSALKLEKNDLILSWLNSNLSIIGSAVFVLLLKIDDFGSP